MKNSRALRWQRLQEHGRILTGQFVRFFPYPLGVKKSGIELAKPFCMHHFKIEMV